MKIKLIWSLLLFVITTIALFYFGTCKNKLLKEKNEKHSVAYEALQFLSSAAAFPNTDIPPAAYGKAWDFYVANYFNSNLRLQNSSSWQSMGPQNIGGRTISIAIDPVDTNIIWLGSASGGLWKSTTGGYGLNAWQYIPTGFPVLGVGAIAINPYNRNEMYIGTGETYDYGTSVNGLVIRTTRGSNGIGILKSLDGGVTWSQTLNWNYNQQRGVWNIVINPQNPNTIYAATTEGVYKSMDAGNTWIQTLNYTMVMDLAIDANDTTILYAGVGNLSSLVHGLYKTTDAGVSWLSLTNGLPLFTNTGRITIDVYKSNSNIVLAHFADDFVSVGLYKSINKGQSWTQVSTNDVASYQGWYSKCLKMHDSDSSHVLVGGVVLFESLTGGTNLSQKTVYDPDAIDTIPWPDLHGIVSNPFDANKIYLLTDAGLYRSNDFGVTWKWCANGYNVSQFYHGSVADLDSNIALGGLQDRNTQRYNGSLNWEAVSGGDGTFNAIDQTNPSIQYAASQYLNVYGSLDSGHTFPKFIFGGNSSAFVAPFMLAPSNNFVMYAGDVNINYSTDQGSFWSGVGAVDNFNAIISMDISYYDADKVYFATAPSDNFPMHVFLSTDGAHSYNEISAGLPNRYPRDIAVDPNNDNTVYVVYSGFGTGHVFKSVNSGDIWTDISATLPDIPFHTVLVNPNNSNMIFVGSDFGIFISKDGGATWQTFNEGLPQAVLVFDLEYSSSNNSLVAFTHGNGVYKIDLKNLNVDVPNIYSSENRIKVYPTIIDQNLTVEFFAEKSAKNYFSLIDLSGKTIFMQDINSLEGKNKININLPVLASGVYFCKFAGKNISVIKKIVKYN